MKRFVVIQQFPVNTLHTIFADDKPSVGEEIVFDADTLVEAELWLDAQDAANEYVIEDTLDPGDGGIDDAEIEEIARYYQEQQDDVDQYEDDSRDYYDDLADDLYNY